MTLFLLPAKTFIKEQGIVFEDWQLAWLFYHSDRGCRWIHAALNEIAERTQDVLLKDQIAFLISMEQKQLNAFKHNAGNAVYILKEQFPGDYGLTRQGS